MINEKFLLKLNACTVYSKAMGGLASFSVATIGNSIETNFSDQRMTGNLQNTTWINETEIIGNRPAAKEEEQRGRNRKFSIT